MNEFVVELRKSVHRMVKYGTREGALKGWETRRKRMGVKPKPVNDPNMEWAKQFAPKGDVRGGGTKRFVIKREGQTAPNGKERGELNLRLPKVAADKIMRGAWKSTNDPAQLLGDPGRVWKGYETVKDLEYHGIKRDSKLFALNALVGATNGRIKAYLEEASRTPKWSPTHHALMYKAEKLMKHRDRVMVPAKMRAWEELQPGGFGKSMKKSTDELVVPLNAWDAVYQAQEYVERGEEIPSELLNLLEELLGGFDGKSD